MSNIEAMGGTERFPGMGQIPTGIGVIGAEVLMNEAVGSAENPGVSAERRIDEIDELDLDEDYDDYDDDDYDDYDDDDDDVYDDDDDEVDIEAEREVLSLQAEQVEDPNAGPVPSELGRRGVSVPGAVSSWWRPGMWKDGIPSVFHCLIFGFFSGYYRFDVA